MRSGGYFSEVSHCMVQQRTGGIEVGLDVFPLGIWNQERGIHWEHTDSP